MSEPRVAVLTLARDRLEYTKACIDSLRANAGILFDHFVHDNGSTDGTLRWLGEEFRAGRITDVVDCEMNAGIHRGMNRLLDLVAQHRYDLLVKVDNDCEFLTPGTLKAVAEHVLENPEQPRVVSPLIHGLRNRPKIVEEKNGLGLTGAIGGIFLPIPPSFVKAGFRYDEAAPVWGGDDERVCAMAQEQGGYCGYLLDFEANHYRTTLGQAEEQVEYFARRVREGGPAL